MTNKLLENFNQNLRLSYPENEDFKNFIMLNKLVTKDVPPSKLELYESITSESLYKEETSNIFFKSICLFNSLTEFYLKDNSLTVTSTEDNFSEVKTVDHLISDRLFRVVDNLTNDITGMLNREYYRSYNKDKINNILKLLNDRFAPSDSFENKLYIVVDYVFYYLIVAYSCYLILASLITVEKQAEFLTFLNNSF